MLYIVPTPIGNIEDISLRAIRLFKEIDYIISENTITSKKLLKLYEIDYQTKHFIKFTSHDTHRINTIIRLCQDQDVVLVSEAGTPALSDPWKQLIQAFLDLEIPVSALPWANALIPAVIMSNFPTTHRSFYGFLPHKKWRQTLLKKMIESDHASFFYESVHRIIKLTEQLEELNYQWKISIAREISKTHEQFITHDLNHIKQLFSNGKIPQLWEFVIGLYPSS